MSEPLARLLPTHSLTHSLTHTQIYFYNIYTYIYIHTGGGAAEVQEPRARLLPACPACQRDLPPQGTRPRGLEPLLSLY